MESGVVIRYSRYGIPLPATVSRARTIEIFNVQRTVQAHFAAEKAFTVSVPLERFEPVRVESSMAADWLIWSAVMSWDDAETRESPLPLTIQFKTDAVAQDNASVALSECPVSPSFPSSSRSGTRNSNPSCAGL